MLEGRVQLWHKEQKRGCQVWVKELERLLLVHHDAVPYLNENGLPSYRVIPGIWKKRQQEKEKRDAYLYVAALAIMFPTIMLFFKSFVRIY